MRPSSRRNFFRASLILAGVATAGGLATELGKDSVSTPMKTMRTPASKPTPLNLKALRPSQVLDLSTWKISLPVGADATQVTEPGLIDLSDANFKVSCGVQFTVPVGGSVQRGAVYPRSELREMDTDGNAAAWSTATGRHTMEIVQRITHLPKVKAELIAGQIHDPNEYVALIRLDRSNLFVEYKGHSIGVLNPDYALGTTFTVKIVAGGGFIDVYYNDVRKAHQSDHRSGCYFKAGCYLQSNPSHGDASHDFGQVEIFDLNVQHSA
jgi:hypothetical protein